MKKHGPSALDVVRTIFEALAVLFLATSAALTRLPGVPFSQVDAGVTFAVVILGGVSIIVRGRRFR